MKRETKLFKVEMPSIGGIVLDVGLIRLTHQRQKLKFYSVNMDTLRVKSRKNVDVRAKVIRHIRIQKKARFFGKYSELIKKGMVLTLFRMGGARPKRPSYQCFPCNFCKRKNWPQNCLTFSCNLFDILV